MRLCQTVLTVPTNCYVMSGIIRCTGFANIVGKKYLLTSVDRRSLTRLGVPESTSYHADYIVCHRIYERPDGIEGDGPLQGMEGFYQAG